MQLDPNTTRKCVTCGHAKPLADYERPQGRRCHACWEAVRATPCVICGQPAGIVHGDFHARKTCERPECLTQLQSLTMSRLGAERTARAAAAKTRVCASCKVRKPLTEEHWAKAATNGPAHRSLHYYCKPCSRAYVNDRRRRARGQLAVVGDLSDSRPRPVSADGFPMLAARPLAQTIVKAAEFHPEGLLGFCVAHGLEDRNVRAWLSDRPTVQFDVADRAVTALGLLWFDVWDPATPEGKVAAQAFEGDEAVAA